MTVGRVPTILCVSWWTNSYPPPPPPPLLPSNSQPGHHHHTWALPPPFLVVSDNQLVFCPFPYSCCALPSAFLIFPTSFLVFLLSPPFLCYSPVDPATHQVVGFWVGITCDVRWCSPASLAPTPHPACLRLPPLAGGPFHTTVTFPTGIPFPPPPPRLPPST